jgi:pimeloyl-ACP methyl ester carboxylesterase
LENTEITVIAHSMGAIVIDQILSQFMDFKIDNIVYMGSATTTRSFLTRAGPYLRKYPSTRFYNLMLHPLAEVRETTFGGLLPSGSLLEWIDDMFENPKTLADRTFGKWRNVALTKDIFPKDIQDQMLFKIFGFQEGHNRVCENGHVWPDPITHGAFNDTRMFYWHPRFWARNSGKVKWAGAKASRPPEILCPSG